MPRYQIEYNQVTTLRREIPDEIGDVKAAKIAIYNRSGGVLLAATAATVTNVGSASAYSWKGVLTNATLAGENTCTLNATPDTIYAGDLYRIGSDTSSQDTLVVDNYNASTRVVTFSDWFRHAHAAGEYCKPRFVTYNLTTTTVATWTANLDLTIVWTFYADGGASTTPYMPYSDEGRIVSRVSGEGGLEKAFRTRYRRFSELVDGESFQIISDDATNELRDLFGIKGLDVDKVVDSHTFYELRLVQMAYSLAYGLGGDADAERVALTNRRMELIKLVEQNRVWSDNNQDLVEADEEVQQSERPYPRRRI